MVAGKYVFHVLRAGVIFVLEDQATGVPNDMRIWPVVDRQWDDAAYSTSKNETRSSKSVYWYWMAW